jgi:dethiobiotin synthetase
MKRGIFVTGTDTGVGKTLVASALAYLLKNQGLDVGVMKPVATGAKRGAHGLVSEDAVLLMEAVGSQDPYQLVNPICLPSPLAPMVASQLDGQPIELDSIWTAFKSLRKMHEFLVVEGIGGLLVPIMKDFYVADMVRRMGLPLLIVSRPSLGTINHTLLTIEGARRRRLTIKGVVLNNTSPGGEEPGMQGLNKAEIERHSGVPVLASIPYITNLKEGSICPEVYGMLSPLLSPIIHSFISP